MRKQFLNPQRIRVVTRYTPCYQVPVPKEGPPSLQCQSSTSQISPPSHFYRKLINTEQMSSPHRGPGDAFRFCPPMLLTHFLRVTLIMQSPLRCPWTFFWILLWSEHSHILSPNVVPERPQAHCSYPFMLGQLTIQSIPVHLLTLPWTRSFLLWKSTALHSWHQFWG